MLIELLRDFALYKSRHERRVASRGLLALVRGASHRVLHRRVLGPRLLLAAARLDEGVAGAAAGSGPRPRAGAWCSWDSALCRAEAPWLI